VAESSFSTDSVCVYACVRMRVCVCVCVRMRVCAYVFVRACARRGDTQALGTLSGSVHLLDHNGVVKRTIRCHRQRVNDVSVDLSGDFVASCSDDGTVVVSQVRGCTA
jgi:hypothetical protein